MRTLRTESSSSVRKRWDGEHPHTKFMDTVKDTKDIAAHHNNDYW
jgi:hypothetical protein